MEPEKLSKSEFTLIQQMKDCKRTTRSLATANDLLVSGTYDNTVNVFQLEQTPEDSELSDSGVILPRFKMIRTFDMFETCVQSVSICPEEKLVGVGCKGGAIYLIGIESDFLQIIPDAHAKTVSSLSFYTDGDESNSTFILKN